MAPRSPVMTPLQAKLYNWLRQRESATLAEMVDVYGKKEKLLYASIYASIKRLESLHKVRRYKIEGQRNILFTVNDDDPDKNVKLGEKLLITVKEKAIRPHNPQSMEHLLARWAEQKWEPRIFRSARGLPLGLARLYELAVEISFGSVVTKEDLSNIQREFEQFRTDLQATLDVLNGFLIVRELFDPAELPAFLLTSSDLDRYSKLAFQAKKIN